MGSPALEGRDEARYVRGRLVRAIVVILAGVAIASQPAFAKVWFDDLAGREVRWGQRVATTILGCPGNDACRKIAQGEVVYLRRGAMTRTAITLRRLRRIGRIDSNGRLLFRVPRVRGGRYHLVAWVGEGSQRRSLPVSATFRIARS